MTDFSELADELMNPTTVTCVQCGKVFNKTDKSTALQQFYWHRKAAHPRPEEGAR